MSADNGIYILYNLDGYRVIEAQAIGNLYWWYTCCNNPYVVDDELDEGIYYNCVCSNCCKKNPESEERKDLNPEMLIQYFGKSQVFRTRERAFLEAHRINCEIDDDGGICEYGISEITELKDKPFPIKNEH